MGRTAGNVGQAVAIIGQLTMSQLRDWDFPYDELHFGKPNADLYFDDKSLSSVQALIGLLV
jgi:hypothetical protein